MHLTVGTNIKPDGIAIANSDLNWIFITMKNRAKLAAVDVSGIFTIDLSGSSSNP